MTVDPKVYALAESFVDDILRGLQDAQLHAMPATELLVLYDRAAAAMQQAIEDECEAIRQELTRQ